MGAKLPEIAVIISVIMLGQRFSGYENRPLGYLLVTIGIVAAIAWLHSIYGYYSRKDGIPASVGKLRLIATWVSAAVLLGFVIYPWIVSSRARPQRTSPIIAGTPGANASEQTRADSSPQPREPQKLPPQRANPAADVTSKLPRVSPSPTIINAPNGIGISGGTVTNPTVNNTIIDPLLPPRRISPEDRPTMIEALSRHPTKVTIYAPANSNEASQFATDLHEVLERAGWDMQNEPVRYFISVGPIEEGVLLKVPGEPVAPGQIVTFSPDDPAAILGTRLQQLNIIPKAQRYSDMREGTIQIQIGPQPPR